MNKQDLVKEYYDYGMAVQDIAKELNMPLGLVNSALETPKLKQTEKPAQGLNQYIVSRDYKIHAVDREMPMYELLYEYGPIELNRMLNKLGIKYTCMCLGVHKHVIIALKYHFGYHEDLPKEALNRISYFSTKLRREVDKRDDRCCIRCGRHMPDIKKIRYHKISHPGPMTVDNCATLCVYCRSERIIKQIESSR